MTAQPTAISARSLILGQGHPSQLGRLHQPWRLETAGLVVGVHRATPADLPAVMALIVRSSARSRWQWRSRRGGAVPSISEMAAWLSRPMNFLVLAPGVQGRSPRAVALAGVGELTCAGTAVPHAATAEILVADPWQRLGIGSALVAHLAAASWLLGRRELLAGEETDEETGGHLLAALGEVRPAAHPHGRHARLRMTSQVLTGLGQLRTARLG